MRLPRSCWFLRGNQDAAVAAATVADDARSALLADLLGRAAGYFPRRETRQACGQMVSGLLMDLDDHNCWTIDKFAAIPGHDEIVAMAPAAIYSFLAADSDTQVAIDYELEGVGATVEEVASTWTVMAAAMLVEACGSTAEARRLAARWTRKIIARSAQTVNGRNASAA